ncbi:MAG: protein arginine kinase [Desulfitobacteriaceae bacterium]|nr:protein arginine kinase [Desulfitobacteriaceae bacterium]
MSGTNVIRLNSKWMEGSGPNQDIVISSRVRLARNIKEIPFPHLLPENREREILDMVKNIVEGKVIGNQGGAFEVTNLLELSTLEKWVLVEKHLISPEHAQSNGPKGVALRVDEAISIMVNEEDHLRIQCLLPAMQLNEAWHLANQVDNFIEESIDFAFDREKGYLTSCPTNVGTGMRASVMLHLPGLVLTRQANQVFATMSQIGLTVRGMYGEGTEASGNLFQLSNQVTLGVSEEDIISHLSSVTLQIIEQERYARKALMKEGGEQLEDRVWRAYGVLSHARIITSREAMGLLSELRLGIDQGLIKGIDARIFNTLIVLTQQAFLQKTAGVELSPFQRDLKRAEIIRTKLTEKLGGEKND